MSLDWNYVETICSGDGNFYGGRFFKDAGAAHASLVNSPWIKGDRYSARRLRTSERAARLTIGATPQCVFNARGPAQVGPSSISGMRMLLHLKKEHADTLLIWPFDSIDRSRSVIIEIFPRYFPLSRELSPRMRNRSDLNAALCAFNSEPVSKEPASEDEGDALITAAALRYLSSNAALFQLPDVSIRSEGWIFGVPLPDNPPEIKLAREQVLEIARRLSEDDPFATDIEARATFARLTK